MVDGIDENEMIISGASGIYGPSVLSISEQVELVTRKVPKSRTQSELAGSNENLQWLMGAAAWASFIFLCKPFFDAFFKEVGKDAYAVLRRKLFSKVADDAPDDGYSECLQKIKNAADRAKMAGNIIVIGLPVSSNRYQRRNLGIELKGDPEYNYDRLNHREFVRSALILGNTGPEIQNLINGCLADPSVTSVRAATENSDGSGAIIVVDDGSVEFSIDIYRGDQAPERVTLRWDGLGNAVRQ